MKCDRSYRLATLLTTAIWVVALLALLVLLAGCGGDSDPLPDVSTPYINCHKGACT